MEKYALLVGGAATHRHDLSQMVMLKGASVHICVCIRSVKSALYKYVYYVVCGMESLVVVVVGLSSFAFDEHPTATPTHPYLPTHAPQPTPPHEQTDNHVWSAGSITKAVHTARGVAGFSMKIEVEARTVEEALEAVRGFVEKGALTIVFWASSPGCTCTSHAHAHGLPGLILLASSPGFAYITPTHTRTYRLLSTRPETKCAPTIQSQAGAGAEIVMLDNFDPPGLKAAAEQVKARFPHVTIEASGVRFFDVCVCVALVPGEGCIEMWALNL